MELNLCSNNGTRGSVVFSLTATTSLFFVLKKTRREWYIRNLVGKNSPRFVQSVRSRSFEIVNQPLMYNYLFPIQQKNDEAVIRSTFHHAFHNIV